jgi:hypothetical protein
MNDNLIEMMDHEKYNTLLSCELQFYIYTVTKARLGTWDI